MFLEFATLIPLFCIADKGLTAIGAQNPYYLVHAVHNVHIVRLTWPDVVSTFTDFHGLAFYPINYEAVWAVVALHLYHCILYWRKFRPDDWLHHILMIGVAIPIGLSTASSTLMGYSLFFTTGLPGGIDYFLLFLVRNGFLARAHEKRVNTWLNVWIRSPGAVSHAALVTAAVLSQEGMNPWWSAVCLVPAALTYWNGQYFMQQVVRDWARVENVKEE